MRSPRCWLSRKSDRCRSVMMALMSDVESVAPAYGVSLPPLLARKALMIAMVFVGFDLMSASAIINCASSPVARRIGVDADVYFVSIQIGTPVPPAVLPVLTTGTRGSLRFRYRGPTDDPELIAPPPASP